MGEKDVVDVVANFEIASILKLIEGGLGRGHSVEIPFGHNFDYRQKIGKILIANHNDKYSFDYRVVPDFEKGEEIGYKYSFIVRRKN